MPHGSASNRVAGNPWVQDVRDDRDQDQKQGTNGPAVVRRGQQRVRHETMPGGKERQCRA
jgi:hypothetical protein